MLKTDNPCYVKLIQIIYFTGNYIAQGIRLKRSDIASFAWAGLPQVDRQKGLSCSHLDLLPSRMMRHFYRQFTDYSMLKLAVGYIYTSDARVEVISFLIVFKHIDIAVRLDLRR
jgi:hypothetical protein